ncbi:MAG: FxLYD domain-containing protein [Candidatus Krumholzibacteria bacterium]|nr:FxLYD domain-containing protein [Candidatus Krumholzibacteria bacterium]MDP6668808.1 FxLYD domain-containing protein [Candidatus Krumholzibacteria bacterium]MDP6796934.1 FxLYD domain-containing protein [Candidatus Krumholzibacteria bacterium]MDP7022329.1 FxLYD domain-containing protein [Candidatus Krumholzibacteria bacterium]
MKYANLFTTGILALLALLMGCNSMQTSSAILRYQQGEFEMAESLCVEALKVNSEDGEAFFYMALAQSELQDYRSAYDNFRKASEMKPERLELAEANIEKNWRDVYNEGVSYTRDENFDVAIEFFTLATEANPENPKGYSNLSKAYWSKAEKIRKLDRFEYLSLLQASLENLELALPLETEEEAREGTARLLCTVLGNLYVNSSDGDRDPFLTRYREVTGEYPDYYSTHEAFGYILYEEGQRNKTFYPFAGQALAQAAKLREKAQDPEGEVAMFAGVAFMTAQLFEQASVNFDIALGINPNDQQLWYYKEFCDYKNLNFQEAIRAAKMLQDSFKSADPEVFKILFLCYKDLAVAADEGGDNEGFLANRTLYEDSYRAFATYKGLADDTPPLLLSQAELAEQERRENALYEKDEVAILDAEIEGRFIKGTLLNKREDLVEYVEVTIDILDEMGEVIDNAYAEVEEIESEQEVEISAFFSADPEEVAGFEVTDLLIE